MPTTSAGGEGTWVDPDDAPELTDADLQRADIYQGEKLVRRGQGQLEVTLPADQPPPPKLTAEERRAREADRLKMIRLRMAIGRELDDQGITDPAAIGAALGMPAAEATALLRRKQWREGDVALLEAAVARLGLPAPRG